MRYDNSQVRRQDRLLTEDRALDLLAGGEYGILSMAATGSDQTVAGYGIPLNYAVEGGSIYFHCAPEGHKLWAVDANPGVSFCVVGRTEVQPGKFTTGYESVIAKGQCTLVEDDTERMHALKLLLEKYSPDHYDTGVKYSQASFSRVAILRLDIETVSGKTKDVW